MHKRVVGFDLARAFAIFGMFMVNFNFAFGAFGRDTPFDHFLNFFIGKATAIFILSAGMGLSFMSQRAFSPEKKQHLKKTILKRSVILFALGLLFYGWWPGDILHFYGGYMHFAVILLFIHKTWYLVLALLVVGVFHVFTFILPIETSWNLNDFSYADFWTPVGFLRNTFYNGWNSIFPWLAYFLMGMYLGHLRWDNRSTLVKTFITGCILYFSMVGLQQYALTQHYSPALINFLASEYFPPYLPFILKTMGFALMVISLCFYVGQKWEKSLVVKLISPTGRMTLSLYVFHITFGMIAFGWITGLSYTGLLQQNTMADAWQIMAFAAAMFLLCVILSYVWLKKFKYGPLEFLLRVNEGKSSQE